MPDYPVLNATQGFPGQLTAVKVTIKSGAAGVSELFPTQGRAVMAIVMPATWVAAAVVFRGALSNNLASILPIYDAGGNPEGTSANAVQATVILFPGDAIFYPFLQLMSATAGSFTPVDQTADRDIILILKDYLS